MNDTQTVSRRGIVKKLILLLAVISSVQMLLGCAIVHRYPAYRGKVLELGTDKPIERVGILMAYWSELASPAGWLPRYLGYQCALTDKEGKFEIPAKFFFIQPLKVFDWQPDMSIYKKGYGNYPGSFHEGLAKQARSAPELDWKRGIPGGEEVTYWLPKFENEQEAKGHFRYRDGVVLGDPFVLPPGMTRQEFRELFDH